MRSQENVTQPVSHPEGQLEALSYRLSSWVLLLQESLPLPERVSSLQFHRPNCSLQENLGNAILDQGLCFLASSVARDVIKCHRSNDTHFPFQLLEVPSLLMV